MSIYKVSEGERLCPIAKADAGDREIGRYLASGGRGDTDQVQSRQWLCHGGSWRYGLTRSGAQCTVGRFGPTAY